MTCNPRRRTVAELQASVSASRLGCFHSCRLRFYYRYVLGLVSPITPARHLGTSVHHALKVWNLARWRKQELPPETLQEQFNASFGQPEQPITWETGEEDETRKQGWSLVELYLKETPIPAAERPEGVEVSVEAELSKHGLTKLVGILDLVRSGGRLVEFKTTGQTPNPEKAEHLHELQCSCYAVMYREATGQTESAVELHHLVKLKTPKLVVTALPAMSAKQETRLRKSVDSYLAGVQRQDWVPSPSPMSCSCCEFFNECRRWS